jgi:phosphinothricin acetyltransferase
VTVIRSALPADAAACQAIYAHHVLHGVGTFEEVPPTVEEMERRMIDVPARGLPWLVAEDEAGVRGFAYAAPFRLRSAYRYTVEDSIYLAADATRQGLGRVLLGELIARCEAMGLRQMVARIGDSANAASIGVHRACGFEHRGVTPALGFKHGRFVDVVWMQRALGDGDGTVPENGGLAL